MPHDAHPTDPSPTRATRGGQGETDPSRRTPRGRSGRFQAALRRFWPSVALGASSHPDDDWFADVEPDDLAG